MSRLAAILVVLGALLGQSRPPARVFLGDSAHPVASGEVWLVAHEWGYYPAVVVASIRNGKLETIPEPRSIKGVEQADDFRLLVAVSDRPLPRREQREVDEAYFALTEGFVREFPYLYLSDPLPNTQQGRDWPTALTRMGLTTNGQTLTLPRPGPRSVRLLYPDGRPFAGVDITVSLFATRNNHCGDPAGVPVGTYRTDGGGRISLTAPVGPLALYQSYHDEESTGPAGLSFVLKGAVITGPEADITLRKWWEPPRRSYVLTLRTSSGQPLSGARLTGCWRHEVCGAVCGPIPIPVAVSDDSGLLQFESVDLRSMATITLTNAAGEEKALSESELRGIMTTGRLVITWP